jgi:hypothetical protein
MSYNVRPAYRRLPNACACVFSADIDHALRGLPCREGDNDWTRAVASRYFESDHLIAAVANVRVAEHKRTVYTWHSSDQYKVLI